MDAKIEEQIAKDRDAVAKILDEAISKAIMVAGKIRVAEVLYSKAGRLANDALGGSGPTDISKFFK